MQECYFPEYQHVSMIANMILILYTSIEFYILDTRIIITIIMFCFWVKRNHWMCCSGRKMHESYSPLKSIILKIVLSDTKKGKFAYVNTNQ